MKRIALWMASLALFAGGCCPNCNNPPAGNGNIDYTVPFCRFGNERAGNSEAWCCSATLVDRNETQGLVLTANHCTDGGPYVVEFTDGTKWTGNLVGQDPDYDLAAIAIRRPDVVPIACGRFTGEGMYRAYGFGGHGEFACVQGYVTDYHHGANSSHNCYVGINGAPIPGDSGSGTVNEQGELCGVLWGVAGDTGYITVGKPVSNFLKRLVAAGKWQPSSTFMPGGESPYSAEQMRVRAIQGRERLLRGRPDPPRLRRSRPPHDGKAVRHLRQLPDLSGRNLRWPKTRRRRP